MPGKFTTGLVLGATAGYLIGSGKGRQLVERFSGGSDAGVSPSPSATSPLSTRPGPDSFGTVVQRDPATAHSDATA